jgi:hypothetical protein
MYVILCIEVERGEQEMLLMCGEGGHPVFELKGSAPIGVHWNSLRVGWC